MPLTLYFYINLKTNPMKKNKYIALMVVLFLIIGANSCEQSPKTEAKKAETGDTLKSSQVVEVDKTEEANKPIKEETELEKAEKKLIGKHVFGVQFIWDAYGKANITKESDVLKIKGEQFSKDKSEYAKIDGDITIIDEKRFDFVGNIQIFTNDCCGKIDINDKFTFAKKGKRKYWRLQEFNRLCDQYTCAYYMDLFE